MPLTELGAVTQARCWATGLRAAGASYLLDEFPSPGELGFAEVA